MRTSIPVVALALLVPAAPVEAQEADVAAVILGAAPRIECPMPVAVPEQRSDAGVRQDDMPILRPDPTRTHRMLVVRPACHNPLGPQPPRVQLDRVARPQPEKPAGSIMDLFGGGWLKRQPADTSKRPPGR